MPPRSRLALRSLAALAAAMLPATLSAAPLGVAALAPVAAEPLVVADATVAEAALDVGASSRGAAKARRGAKAARAAKASRARSARTRTATRGARSAKATRGARAGRSVRKVRKTRLPRLATAARAPEMVDEAALLGGVATLGGRAVPLTLRGSRAAVDEAYDAARAIGLPFARTRSEVVRLAAEGDYVRLETTRDYRLGSVSTPYVRPATRRFLASFGASYRAACGEPVTVTSAVRPTSVRLRNSVEKSVHPTGMALDLRIPRGRGCRTWVRRELLLLERQGVVQATEERRPPHFHVVVLHAP